MGERVAGREPAVGVYAHLPTFTLAVRGLGHVAQTAMAWRHGRGRAVIAGSLSIVGDLTLAALQWRQRHLGPAARTVADAADLGVWLLGVPAADPGPAFNGVEISRGAERAFIDLAGTEATPVVPGTRPHPTSLGEWLTAGLRLGAPMLVSIGAMIGAGRGSFRQVPWLASAPIISVCFGAHMTHLRHREQAHARRQWSERAEAQIERARFAARYQAATEHHEGHNFKRVLYALGDHSAACHDAARRAAARPSMLAASRRDGATLAEAARYHEIEPPRAGATWLTDGQADQLKRFIEEAEAEPRSHQPRLRVGARQGADVAVSYFGHQRWLTSRAPTLEATIDPIVAALAFLSAFRLLAIHPGNGGFRARTALTLTLLDGLVLAGVSRSEAASVRPVRPTVAAATASSLLWFAAIARGHAGESGPAGEPVNPGGPVALVLGPISYYWDDLGRWGWVAAPLVLASQLGVLVTRRIPTNVGFIVAELASAAQYPAAFAGMRRRLDEERDTLAEALAERFAADAEAARAEEHDRERDRIAGLVDLAEGELTCLTNDPAVDLDPVDVGRWWAEITKVRAWLANPAS